MRGIPALSPAAELRRASGLGLELGRQIGRAAIERGELHIIGLRNFDADNRESFGAAGPGAVPPRASFEPDAVTREVIALVNTRFAPHPGRLDHLLACLLVARHNQLAQLLLLLKGQ